MEQNHNRIEAAGLRSVVVGIGEPRHAARYCPQLAPGATCLCQPEAQAHTAFGLRQGGLGQLAGPQMLMAATRALAEGKRQGQATGDVKMLGGAFVVGQGGRILFSHYDRFAGDHADLDQALAAAGALARG